MRKMAEIPKGEVCAFVCLSSLLTLLFSIFRAIKQVLLLSGYKFQLPKATGFYSPDKIETVPSF